MKKLLILLIVTILTITSFTVFFVFADDTVKDEDFEGGGDLSRLIVPKTTYTYDEPINITAIGSGKDYVGIYFPDDPYSLRWTYVDKNEDRGVGSGVEFNLKTAGYLGSNAPETLPVGEFIIRLQPNDSGNFNVTIAWVKIRIVPGDTELPEKPVSATYDLKDKTSGFATGKLTVRIKENEIAKNIVPFWGDEKGKLEGYTSLPKFKATSTEVSYDFPENLIIPTGATKLLVYTSNFFDQLSEECYEIKLPDGCAFKDPGAPIVEFQVVSDIHVVDKSNHTHNTNYINMLNDISKNSPNSMAMFIVGDMVDSGWESEYKKMANLYKTVDNLPPYYMAIGNHDLWSGTLQEQNDLFLKYAKLPNGLHPKSTHYDFWLNGYHFIFVGNDNLVNMIDATLSNETLDWLDKTLAEDRDANRPSFIFLHQGIYNTVAGTLSGQNWNGIVSASELKLKVILRKYPEVIMFNGHSHWEFDSERNMYPRSSSLPTIFNTSAVAYLTTSYNKQSGEKLAGSEGYYIRVYQDKVMVLGRDFTTGEWKSSAQYFVNYDNGTGPKKYQVTLDTLGVGTAPQPIMVAPNGKITPPTPTAEGYVFEGWYTNKTCTKEFDPQASIDKNITLYAKWSELPESETSPTTVVPTATATDTDTNTPSSNTTIITVAIVSCCVLVAVVVFIVIKKKKITQKN